MPSSGDDLIPEAAVLDSHQYIEPEDRSAAWATMARQYVARGWPRDEIAYALCVDEPTVERLLAAGGAAQQEDTAHVQ